MIVQGRVLPSIMPTPHAFKQLWAQKLVSQLALANPWSETPNCTVETALEVGAPDRAAQWGSRPSWPSPPFGLLVSSGKGLSGDKGDCILSLKQFWNRTKVSSLTTAPFYSQLHVESFESDENSLTTFWVHTTHCLASFSKDFWEHI